jgi:hypothetical protein
MPIKLCAYGFSCASMMMQPGLTAEDCPNQDTCGTIRQLTPPERIELYQRRAGNGQTPELISISAEQAALLLLHSRGCPQTPTSLGVTATIERLRETIAHLEAAIEQISANQYIAPESVEAHRYLVTRPYGIYQYNKLTSTTAIFPPQHRENSVKVVHLSKDSDPRNFEGRSGIERRNRLLAIATSVQAATNILERATERALNPPITEVVAAKIAFTPSRTDPEVS